MPEWWLWSFQWRLTYDDYDHSSQEDALLSVTTRVRQGREGKGRAGGGVEERLHEDFRGISNRPKSTYSQQRASAKNPETSLCSGLGSFGISEPEGSWVLVRHYSRFTPSTHWRVGGCFAGGHDSLGSLEWSCCFFGLWTAWDFPGKSQASGRYLPDYCSHWGYVNLPCGVRYIEPSLSVYCMHELLKAIFALKNKSARLG